jgi:crotonobetainyl-CoA:carnitine CoA-transferase CaiB-like acyl-CoA transferase
MFVAGPAAASLLADWGAEVIKVEGPEGDPLRTLGGPLPDGVLHPGFVLDNRGKRSICLDVRTDAGAAVARDLIRHADVFITNLRPAALSRFGLDWESLSADHPSLVYASVTGYGLHGPDAGRAAFDTGAYWSRAGVALSLGGADSPPLMQRGGMGDHWAGVSLALGITLALLERTGTGRGQLVSTSLLRVGAYTVSWDLSTALLKGAADPHVTRATPGNPLYNSYRTRDGRWIWLLCLDMARHWDDAIRVFTIPAEEFDGSFQDPARRQSDCDRLQAHLEERFATRTLAEWAQLFDANEIWWAPMQLPADLIHDPQAGPAGVFVDLDDDTQPRTVAGPVDLSDHPPTSRPMAPTLGEQTRQILDELGYDAKTVADLYDDRVVA